MESEYKIYTCDGYKNLTRDEKKIAMNLYVARQNYIMAVCNVRKAEADVDRCEPVKKLIGKLKIDKIVADKKLFPPPPKTEEKTNGVWTVHCADSILTFNGPSDRTIEDFKRFTSRVVTNVIKNTPDIAYMEETIKMINLMKELGYDAEYIKTRSDALKEQFVCEYPQTYDFIMTKKIDNMNDLADELAFIDRIVSTAVTLIDTIVTVDMVYSSLMDRNKYLLFFI